MKTSTEVLTAPSCDECATELQLIGTGSPRYWSCRYCGTCTPAHL